MPPPTAGDAWFNGRRFGIVIDAGSSGSRLQIYSWTDPRSFRYKPDSEAAHSLPKVEKGAPDGKAWIKKVEPGLSSFADNVEGVPGHLAPLLRLARDLVPPSLQPQTPLFLLATAGMRLLTEDKQSDVLRQTCRFLKTHSHFRIEEPSPIGPCGSSVRIISGEEEGLFGWIAVNYLMDGFTGKSEDRTTYGFLDMGGASTQIAFEPSIAHQEDVPELTDVRLRLLGGEEIHHKVFVTTWLGYGTNQARERYVGKAITDYEKDHFPSPNKKGPHVIPDPCLPKSLKLIETPVHAGSSTEHMRKSHTLVGTGSFEQCMAKTATLLNKSAPCPDTPCLFNGVHVPPIDFSVSHFIGVSEYYYSSEQVFGLGGSYDYVQYELAASKFCSREWEGIVQEHAESRVHLSAAAAGLPANPGPSGGTVFWGDKVELSRLEMSCFKAAWIANVLHEGIGMPRIVDPGGNITITGTELTEGDKVAQQADNKGLGPAKVKGKARPAFQSADTVGDIAISWTLGKMVLEASKEVPALSTSLPPILDPMEPTVELPTLPPPQRLSIGTHISSAIPSAFLIPFYSLAVCLLAVLAYRLRRTLRPWCLRAIGRVPFLKSSTSHESTTYLLEEGQFMNGNGASSRPPSRPPSRPATPPPTPKPWPYPLRRVLSFTRSQPPSVARQPPPVSGSTVSVPALQPHVYGNQYKPAVGYASQSNPARIAPARSYSMPQPHEGTTFLAAPSSTANDLSRTPSPDNGIAYTSRARNSSMLNLVPRQSRNSSMANGMIARDD